MNADLYATALYHALDGVDQHEHDRLFERFVTVVKARRHERLFPAIVRAFEKKISRAKRQERTHIVFASTHDASTLAHALQADLRTLGAEDAPYVSREDPSLIGGYVITTHGKRIDASYKRTLLELYHSLIRS